MKTKLLILLAFLLLLSATRAAAQTDTLPWQLQLIGQVSAFMLINPNNTLPVYTGGRYLPQLNLEKPLPRRRLFNVEASANLSGRLGMQLFDTTATAGDLRPYRAWVRYTRPQLEIRAGLQKINFGAATILRPLMWFDQIDPRDPLQITDGVWGVLGRYYFLNNANIWLWALYGNPNRRGFDAVPTARRQPEFGGRLQWPTSRGEVAATYHYRRAEFEVNGSDGIPEHRFGLDGKWDVTVGLWVEASWVHKTRPAGILTNRTMITLGSDYTFGIGNGLNVIAEQLLFAFDETPFAFSSSLWLTALSAGYPLGLFDQLSNIIYFDWTNRKLYTTLQWQHTFPTWTLNVLAFWNPKDSQLPQQGQLDNLFGGQGIQILAVYHH